MVSSCTYESMKGTLVELCAPSHNHVVWDAAKQGPRLVLLGWTWNVGTCGPKGNTRKTWA